MSMSCKAPSTADVFNVDLMILNSSIFVAPSASRAPLLPDYYCAVHGRWHVISEYCGRMRYSVLLAHLKFSFSQGQSVRGEIVTRARHKQLITEQSGCLGSLQTGNGSSLASGLYYS
jgi:hypothetical protein